ncbi:transcriptional regulator [Kribbella sp. NPDC058245]|uniref:transcriptional regulator n=1 Tax=Kribbella sp. NPDC058245 TaxID=3346399 RepID=UPI0036EC24F8
MSRASTPELLTLHAVRLLGVGDEQAIADRFALDLASTKELLLDHQAFGWISWSQFADIGGWSLTESGRAENERGLAAELGSDADTVSTAYSAFLPLNGRLQAACTQWQLKPAPGDAMAFNDHTDPAWDQAVLDELAAIGQELTPLATQLTATLDRFAGYDTRYTRAHQAGCVDSTTVDSCHRVWFELHEDLIATLGVRR